MMPSETIGYVASALVLTTFCMRRMAPLRMAAICSNVAFITYALQRDLPPVLALHIVLLPLNLQRLLEAWHPTVSSGPASTGSPLPTRGAELAPHGHAAAIPMPISARRVVVRAVLGVALASMPAARLTAQSASDLPDFWLQAVWLPPAPTPNGEAWTPGDLALLHIPMGWSNGDAAVVVLWDGGSGRSGSRNRVSHAFVTAGAAVLEVGYTPAAPDGSVPDPSLLPRALQALRHDLGAGLLVAVGNGEGGRAALSGTLAAQGASTKSPTSGPAVAAAIAIAGGDLRVAPGEVPGASEAWPVRGRLLCEVLAAAMATDAEEEHADPAISQVRRDDCLAGLRLR